MVGPLMAGPLAGLEAWGEAPQHPHHVARGTFVQHAGLEQAAPAPRFSRSSAAIGEARDADEMAARWEQAAVAGVGSVAESPPSNQPY